MTRPSKRELEREMANIRPESDTTATAAVELEGGEYVTPSGDPVDWEDVIFKIPYDVWSKWPDTDDIPGWEV